MNQNSKINREEILLHRKDYNSRTFWDKLKHHAKKIGTDGVRKGIILWYVLQRPDVPLKTKAIIIGALGYLIVPFDLIFDGLPWIGYTDDITALAYAYHEASAYIDNNMKNKANTWVQKYF